MLTAENIEATSLVGIREPPANITDDSLSGKRLLSQCLSFGPSVLRQFVRLYDDQLTNRTMTQRAAK
jgi:hypothetical protein